MEKIEAEKHLSPIYPDYFGKGGNGEDYREEAPIP
jgi:hypothetical protein